MRTVDPVRHAARRNAILDASAIEFATRGFEATTVKAICAAANVGSGTLFHYFKDKRAILHAIVARDAESMRDTLEGLDDLSGSELLWSAVGLMVAEIDDPLAAGMVACLLPQLMTDEALAVQFGHVDAHTRAVLIRALNDLDTDISPEVGATWIMQFVDGLYLRCGDADFDPSAELALLRLVITRFLGLDAQAS